MPRRARVCVRAVQFYCGRAYWLMSCLGRGKDDGESSSWALMVENLFKNDAEEVMENEGEGGSGVQQLASDLDVDSLGKNFGKFAGSDDVMDKEEFERFTKETNITRTQASALWNILDQDGSGRVDKREFATALTNLQQARAWLRYCPECVYTNTCTYCQECNSDCADCTEDFFCSAHWADHPARKENAEVEADAAEVFSVGSAEYFRRNLVIRPLSWAYTSQTTAWLPVTAKAVLRQALRHQQLANAKAAQDQAAPMREQPGQAAEAAAR